MESAFAAPPPPRRNRHSHGLLDVNTNGGVAICSVVWIHTYVDVHSRCGCEWDLQRMSGCIYTSSAGGGYL